MPGSRDRRLREPRRVPLCLGVIAGLAERHGEIRRQRQAPLVSWWKDGSGPAQQPTARVEVAAIESASAGSCKMVGRADGESKKGWIVSVELRAVAMRLLEVVPDDLVTFDEIMRREPVARTARGARARVAFGSDS